MRRTLRTTDGRARNLSGFLCRDFLYSLRNLLWFDLVPYGRSQCTIQIKRVSFSRKLSYFVRPTRRVLLLAQEPAAAGNRPNADDGRTRGNAQIFHAICSTNSTATVVLCSRIHVNLNMANRCLSRPFFGR